MRSVIKPLAAATDAPLGIGPSDVQPLPPDVSERTQRIREMFVERHAAWLIEAIEAGRLGLEFKKRWRRFETNGMKSWPWTEKRKARKV